MIPRFVVTGCRGRLQGSGVDPLAGVIPAFLSPQHSMHMQPPRVERSVLLCLPVQDVTRTVYPCQQDNHLRPSWRLHAKEQQ